MLGRIVSVSTPPVALPVSLADMKAHLRVTSTAEDDTISAYLAAAVASLDVQGELGFAMELQTISEALQYPARDVVLSVPPAQELISVTYFDTDNAAQTADLADFAIYKSSDRSFVRSDNWPAAYDRPDAVTINYTAGHSVVPSDLSHAIKLIVGHWYEHRADVSEQTLTEIPRAVQHLLGLHRRAWYG